MKQSQRKLAHVSLDAKSMAGLAVASDLLGISRSELLRRFGYLMFGVAVWNPVPKSGTDEERRDAFIEDLAAWPLDVLARDFGPDAMITRPVAAPAPEGA